MKTKTSRILAVVLIFQLLAFSACAGWLIYDAKVDRSGWAEKDGVRFYRDFHAKPVTGWLDIDGQRYFFLEGGIPATGWLEQDGVTRYFGSDGVMLTGWQTIGGKTYCFGDDGGMLTGWQQLDTTLCMRILLDPEKDAARPLDLLGNTPHPAAARHACNAVRMARNEAAHASDRTAAAQAAIRFNEAVEELEAGYEGTALTTGDLEKYYRMAEDFLSRCGAKKPIASAAPEEKAPRAAKSGQSTAGRKKEGSSF